jgi:hypothetical protein
MITISLRGVYSTHSPRTPENLTMTLLGSKPGSCGEKPTNNGLDHGTTNDDAVSVVTPHHE